MTPRGQEGGEGGGAKMAAMAALCRRLRALGRGVRGLQTPPAPPRYEESTAEFGFVQRLLPPSRVPEPPPHPKYPTPSGWSPPAGCPPELPYFVGRSRMHNLPVYLSRRQGRRLTALRRIHGDIWALERDLRAFLGSLGLPEVRAQVNEVTGTLRLRGHCGHEVRQWLLQSGF
ncbi:39S ribosomal protein L49, mitochondrial [Oenanthe melanoleuca]|uniref:39S ribosomal protein L49, mitochondrial n=1 Tax=Oenanthe melanoleuca TaxID=2939378 RepID=UPI0024C1E564|nr:39S ribosomal protein L49, mitochondrial [Oenanthe melanoleuca]